MRTSLWVCLTLLVSGAWASGGSMLSKQDKNEVRLSGFSIKPDEAYQQELRKRGAWEQFINAHGTWYVTFNERNGMPHRAFGQPVPVNGADGQSMAMDFILNHLGSFAIPHAELEFVKATFSGDFHYVHFRQVKNGLEVLFSDLYVKISADGKVVSFGVDIFKDIPVFNASFLSEADARSAAAAGLQSVQILSSELNSDLTILPIPKYRSTEYRPVYTVIVKTIGNDGVPGNYRTLVDAETGKVYIRQNQVKHFAEAPPANTDVTINGSLFLTHPFHPSSVHPLRNLKVMDGSNVFYTDSSGYVGLGNTAPATLTIPLEGSWSQVITNGATPSLTATVNPGSNTLSFDPSSSIRERSAYYHVNVVHDYMKSKFPSFTDLDYPLATNVDLTSGDCNAFYDGSSINFYATGNGCNSLAQVADVVYHEYGHGINDLFYLSQGAFFQNGAMNEGYADIWALGITANPVLGVGFDQTDSTVFVRRYDQDIKVYPQDLVGQVHADGEIICGAWWDTGINFGDLQDMMDLYKETFFAVVTGADGDEGQVYVDILIEALTSDDSPSNGGDNNIVNGTPRDNAIIDGFALHGITLLSNAELLHVPVESMPSGNTINVQAFLTLTYAWALDSVVMFYKINRNGPWIETSMVNTTGNLYSASIPGQPLGTVIAYYLGLSGTNGNALAAVQPINADLSDPNVPYYILVGAVLAGEEDFDDNFGQWTLGVSGDDATTGVWVIDLPVASYADPFDLSTICQPGTQHTPNGLYCAVTGNANTTTEGLGTNDIDNGQTTLESPGYDLSGYINPIFTYYRWYINNPPTGANPGNDAWEVQISNNGTDWVQVERTKTSDKSWRRVAFRVTDYVSLSNNVKLRFVAEDSLTSALPFPDNGQSIVEAAIDDIFLYEQGFSGLEEAGISGIVVYPNPAEDQVFIDFIAPKSETLTIRIDNALGQQSLQTIQSVNQGTNRLRLSTDQLAAGIYSLTIQSKYSKTTRKLTVR